MPAPGQPARWCHVKARLARSVAACSENDQACCQYNEMTHCTSPQPIFDPAPTNWLTEERFHDEAYAREAWQTNCFNGSGLGPQAADLFQNRRAAGVSWFSARPCLASCCLLTCRLDWMRPWFARQPGPLASQRRPQGSALKLQPRRDVSFSPPPLNGLRDFPIFSENQEGGRAGHAHISARTDNDLSQN